MRLGLLNILVLLCCCWCWRWSFVTFACIVVLRCCLYMENNWHFVIVYGVGMHELGHWDYITVLSQNRYQLVLTTSLFRALSLLLSIHWILFLYLFIFSSPLFLYSATISIIINYAIQMTRIHNNLLNLFYLRLQHMIELFATTIVIIYQR